MLKKALFSMVFLGMSVAPLFAQSNVEKALRFRAESKTPKVAVQSDVPTRTEQTRGTRSTPAPLTGSSFQLKDLGGFAWNNSGSQLEDLGCSHCNRGNIFSSGQLKDLGGYIWSSNDSQLKDLGGYIWNHDGGQLKELGGFIWSHSGSQLEDLGGYIWNSSDSQLEDLGGYIWLSNGSQLEDLGCPYCGRGWAFSAGQLEGLGQSRYGRPH